MPFLEKRQAGRGKRNLRPGIEERFPVTLFYFGQPSAATQLEQLESLTARASPLRGGKSGRFLGTGLSFVSIWGSRRLFRLRTFVKPSW